MIPMKWMNIVLLFILVTSTHFSILNSDQANAARINCWALIIGISDYEQQNDLNYAHTDANDMADVLINYHNWPESHIYKLINSSATKSNILDHIARIDDQEDSDDLFLFFFAGHGSQGIYDQFPYDESDSMDEYIIPYDCNGNTETPQEIIIDPCAGSGSTLMACELSNRKGYMIELDPKYTDVILNRWQIFTGKNAIRESDNKKWAEINQ